jgi:hypothetical protein
MKPEPENPKDLANEMMGNLIALIRPIGQHRAKEAMEKLDSVSWWAIESFGGWTAFCLSDIESNSTTRAQMRDICMSALSVAKRDPQKLKPHQLMGSQRLSEHLTNLITEEKIEPLKTNNEKEHCYGIALD